MRRKVKILKKKDVVIIAYGVVLCATSIKSVKDLNTVIPKPVQTVEASTPFIVVNPVDGSERLGDDGFLSTTNLLNRMIISENDVNIIINAHCIYDENKDSVFKDKGKVFIYASQLTGLDPLFILAIMVNTYGWNYSENITYDQFYDDVCETAKWLKDTYYDERNCHSINDMTEISDYQYAASDEWATMTIQLINESYNILNGGN